MMPPSRRRIVLLAVQFLPILALLAFLYPSILPVYLRLVLGSSNAALALLPPPMQIATDVEGRWHVHVQERGGRPDWSFSTGDNTFDEHTFLGLIVLTTLILATPMKVRQRATLLMAGLPLLFLLHVLVVTACVFAMGRLGRSPEAQFWKSLPDMLSPVGEGLAVALWGMLTWRFWFPRIDALDSSPSPLP